MSIFNGQKFENTIIVGCGTLGVRLASLLSTPNSNVSIIDINKLAFSRLSNPSHYCLIEGDAVDADILEKAGIKTADRMIITTDSDNRNIMIAQIAKEYYKVHQVVARIEDTSKEPAYKGMDIDVVSSQILMLNEFQNVLVRENAV